MNYDFMIKHIPMYVEAAKLTLYIGFIGIIISIFIGLLLSVIRYYKVPVLSKIAGAYIELSRNTPLLIQLFFLYFGLPQLGIKLSSVTCAVIGLSFLGSSYMAEAFRSGFEATSNSQIESGISIGLNTRQLIRYVILPQAFSVAVPSISANIIFLLKETSVFSAVALADLMFVAKDLIGLYYKTDEALFMLVISYLIILLPISLILSYIERRVRFAEFGN
ncbi:amino acid ABC transporter permease [Clostridium sp. Marseille-P299]|uniref:amino acid ABC transporter permease n=1 Tax=Clostridium sp. Marseille-P299 TaxID=1805477 RepID=UPI000834F5E0|nr:amino acid ABC transporter permease [Clostridium sp. Marseille-P299]